MRMTKINKALLAIATFALISIFVIFYLVPSFETTIATQNIFVQFLFYNILIFVFIEGLLYFIINGKMKSLKFSLAATLIIMAIDNILPPYAVSSAGAMLPSQQTGFTGATDYFFAQIGLSLGIEQGSLALPIFVYPVMSVIILLIALYFFGGTKFLKNLHEIIS